MLTWFRVRWSKLMTCGSVIESDGKSLTDPTDPISEWAIKQEFGIKSLTDSLQRRRSWESFVLELYNTAWASFNEKKKNQNQQSFTPKFSIAKRKHSQTILVQCFSMQTKYANVEKTLTEANIMKITCFQYFKKDWFLKKQVLDTQSYRTDRQCDASLYTLPHSKRPPLVYHTLFKHYVMWHVSD